MKLYGCAKTRSDRVRWALEEAGATYDYVPIELGRGESRTPDFLALNPYGKVPVLAVDGEVLTESASICRLIADRHPAAGLIPPVGSLARAHCDQWCDFAISELEQPLWLIAKHRFALPPEHRVADLLATAGWEFQRAAAVLAKGLGDRSWILGETFTVADILLGHTLVWARAAGQHPAAANLLSYTERALARPAYERVRAAAVTPQ